MYYNGVKGNENHIKSIPLYFTVKINSLTWSGTKEPSGTTQKTIFHITRHKRLRVHKWQLHPLTKYLKNKSVRTSWTNCSKSHPPPLRMSTLCWSPANDQKTTWLETSLSRRASGTASGTWLTNNEDFRPQLFSGLGNVPRPQCFCISIRRDVPWPPIF